jgi:hypothetical protein
VAYAASLGLGIADLEKIRVHDVKV